MPRRLSAFMSGHPARAAGGLGLGRPLEFARAVRDWFRAGEKKPGLPGARPHSQARARDGSVGVGCARAERTASARACSGVAARPRAMMITAAGDLPVPVAGRAVRGNVVRKCGIRGPGYGIQGLGFEQQHDTSPRVGTSSRSPRGTSSS